MKKLTLISVLGMLLPILNASAQKEKTAQAAVLGRELPDITFHNVINYKDSVFRLSDFRGKMVIIDFWATWCTSCIKHFAENDSLQRVYGDRLQFIMVTQEPTAKAAQFIGKWRTPDGKKICIPVVTADTVIGLRYFPHRVIPHYTWIGPRGSYIGATMSPFVTPKTIDQLSLDLRNNHY